MVRYVLLALLSTVTATDPCGATRCDTAACACGCECGTPDDPGLCYTPKTLLSKEPCAIEHHSPTIKRTVLVTGATGRTGSLIYKRMVAAGHDTRAFVRSADKARKVLGCSLCDESEGIYLGNVSSVTQLERAALGTSIVAIAVGVSGFGPQNVTKAVEFVGVQNTVAALAQPSNIASYGVDGLRVLFVSSMGTTLPAPPKEAGGSILFWKLNAEAFISASGLSFAIVKPGGLLMTAGDNSTLLVGKDDALFKVNPPVVSRDDVARVVVASLEFPFSVRLDIVSKPGPPTTDVNALLKETLYPWQQGAH